MVLLLNRRPNLFIWDVWDAIKAYRGELMDTRFALLVAILAALGWNVITSVNMPPDEDFPITWEQQKKVLALSAHFSLSQAERRALQQQLGRSLDLSRRAPAFGSTTGLKHCEMLAGAGSGYAGMWCQRCQETGPHWQATYLFYPDLGRGSCTLQNAELRILPGQRRMLRAPDQVLFRELVREIDRSLQQRAQTRPYSYDKDRGISPEVSLPNSWKSASRAVYLYANLS